MFILNFDNGNKKKYTKFHHTVGFTHHKSSPIILQVIETHPEGVHVNMFLDIEYSVT